MWWLLIELLQTSYILDSDLSAFHGDEPFLYELSQTAVQRELLYTEIVGKLLSGAVQHDDLTTLFLGLVDQIVCDALLGGQHGELIELGL